MRAEVELVWEREGRRERDCRRVCLYKPSLCFAAPWKGCSIFQLMSIQTVRRPQERWGRERERERGREREGERERERERGTDIQRQGQRDRERDKYAKTEPARVTHTERETESDRCRRESEG